MKTLMILSIEKRKLAKFEYKFLLTLHLKKYRKIDFIYKKLVIYEVKIYILSLILNIQEYSIIF